MVNEGAGNDDRMSPQERVAMARVFAEMPDSERLALLAAFEAAPAPDGMVDWVSVFVSFFRKLGRTDEEIRFLFANPLDWRSKLD